MDQPINAPEAEPGSYSTAVFWRFTDVVWITLGAVAILLLGVLALRLGLKQLPGGIGLSQQPNIWVSAAMGALEAIALIGSVYYLGVRRKSTGWQAVGLRPAPSPWIWIAVGISILVIPLAGLIAAAIQLALGQPVQNPQLPFIAPQGFSWFGMLSMFLLGGILAPIGEELFFRGVIYQWLKRGIGVWPGILVSSLIFGAAHGDLAVGGAAAVLGMVLAGVFEASGSLWPSITIHILNNSVKILLLYALLAFGVNLG